jgi:formylmethanofuran dehydrogenase subunit E
MVDVKGCVYCNGCGRLMRIEDGYVIHGSLVCKACMENDNNGMPSLLKLKNILR